uniref:Uncharacterized protein n=1 Tax=Falco tinnunculus TaxID=100819 RepID=A0A8C4XNK1_FALTI
MRTLTASRLGAPLSHRDAQGLAHCGVCLDGLAQAGAIIPFAAEVIDTAVDEGSGVHNDGGAASVFILGLHVEVGQLGVWPALPGKEVGAGTLEVKEEAIEGVVMWISKHHAGAAFHRHALEELGLQLARFKGYTGAIFAVFLKGNSTGKGHGFWRSFPALLLYLCSPSSLLPSP